MDDDRELEAHLSSAALESTTKRGATLQGDPSRDYIYVKFLLPPRCSYRRGELLNF